MTDQRQCPECQNPMHPIRLLDTGHAGVHSDLEYATPEAHRSFWKGRFPTAGRVIAYMREQCGRIVLYGSAPVPSTK